MPSQDLAPFEAQLGRRRRDSEVQSLLEAQHGSQRSRSYREVFQERIRQEVHRLSRLLWPQPYRDPASLQRFRQPIQGILQGDNVSPVQQNWESIIHLDRIIRQLRLDSRAATRAENTRIWLAEQRQYDFPIPTDRVVIWTTETIFFDAHSVYNRIQQQPQDPIEGNEEATEEATR